MRTTDDLYWLGNAAKAFVIREILRSPKRPLTVLDHGCGRGGSWPEILRDHPDLQLIGWDPDRDAAAAAQKALAGCNATISIGSFPTDATADYVVSFSVLEHVYDKPLYLNQARSALRDDGAFYLNYDDGHFRTVFDPDDRRGSWEALRSLKENLLLGRRPRDGRPYQRRVPVAEADQLIRAAGFRVEACWYQNLVPFKWLSKQVRADQAEEFMAFWLDVESTLNRDFGAELSAPVRGDSSALWQIAPARTLLLRKAL